MTKNTRVEKGSVNVFADIGVSSAEEMIAKAQLAATITGIIDDRGLSQTDAPHSSESTSQGHRRSIADDSASSRWRG